LTKIKALPDQTLFPNLPHKRLHMNSSIFFPVLLHTQLFW